MNKLNFLELRIHFANEAINKDKATIAYLEKQLEKDRNKLHAIKLEYFEELVKLVSNKEGTPIVFNACIANVGRLNRIEDSNLLHFVLDDQAFIFEASHPWFADEQGGLVVLNNFIRLLENKLKP